MAISMRRVVDRLLPKNPENDPEVVRLRNEQRRIFERLAADRDALGKAALGVGQADAERELAALSHSLALTSGEDWNPLNEVRARSGGALRRSTLVGRGSNRGSSAAITSSNGTPLAASTPGAVTGRATIQPVRELPGYRKMIA